MSALNLQAMLHALICVYGALAVGAIIGSMLRRDLKKRTQRYIISNSNGKSMKITLDLNLPAIEQERVLVETVNELARAM